MINNYTICNIKVSNKQDKVLLEEIVEMCKELSPRTVTTYLKDSKGSYKFIKGTKTSVKSDFVLDMQTYDEDVVLYKYSDFLCKSCRVVCRIDLDNPRLKTEYDRRFNDIREILIGGNTADEVAIDLNVVGDVKGEEVLSNIDKGFQPTIHSSMSVNSKDVLSNSGLLSPSSTFTSSLNKRSVSECMLEELANELDSKVNELMIFIDENKLKVGKKYIENVVKKLDYSSDLLKSIIKVL